MTDQAAPSAPAPSASALVAHLMERDRFSQWLGIEVVEASLGRSVLVMTVRDDMVNGFGTLHGGVLFSFADSAFAFVVNSGGAAQRRHRLYDQLPRGLQAGRPASGGWGGADGIQSPRVL